MMDDDNIVELMLVVVLSPVGVNPYLSLWSSAIFIIRIRGSWRSHVDVLCISSTRLWPVPALCIL